MKYVLSHRQHLKHVGN